MIILLWTALALLALGHSSPLDEWRKFKTEYGKEYSGAEDSHRMKVFLENLKRVEEHNSKYEQGLVSFALGVNHLSDLELEEVRMRMMGIREEEEEVGGFETKRRGPEEMAVELPEEVDWRTKGAVTPVKNQGHCGTCWAFSTTGVVEGQLFVKTGKLVSLSEQNLMDCAAHGCKGFSRHTALKYIQSHGIDTEKAYPYMAKTENCSFSEENVATRIKKTVSLPRGNEQALKEAVANIGPISVSLDAGHHSFQAYKKGVYYEPECQTKKRDHAVLVVGYGRESGQDYWLIKNSWRNHWGEAGYMKLARNRDNHCGVASSPLYPLI